ncbi:hypothetical protein B0O99DRAFT_593312 [Bisporella sp. PMI_857]|nr:hypothetical protein B0O99DRAFT_593312 [Bisporella sp. PMI_857]
MILRTNLPEDSPPPDYVEVERGRTLHRKDSNSSLLSERLSEAGRKHIEESRSRSVTPNPSLSRGQSLFRPESSYYTPSPGDDLSTAEESFDPRAIRRCVEQLQECWPEHAQEIDLLYQDEREGPVLPSAQNLAIGFAAELGPIKCTRNHPSKEETCGKLFDRLINLAHHNETVHKHMWTCPLCPTKTIYRNHLFLVFHLESWHHQPNPYILMWYGDPGIEFSDNIWLNLDLQVHHPLDKSSKEGDIQRGETSTNPDAQFEHGAESTQSRTDSSSPPIDPSTNGVDSTKHNGVGSRIETAEFAAAVAEKLQSQNNLLPSEVALSSFLFFEIPPFVSSSMISTIKEMDSSDKATTCKVCNKFRGRPSEVRYG